MTIENTTNQLAFFVHLKLIDPTTDEEVLPILWDDNYITLLPGASRVVTARFLNPAQNKPNLKVVVDGWNIKPSVVFLK